MTKMFPRLETNNRFGCLAHFETLEKMGFRYAPTPVARYNLMLETQFPARFQQERITLPEIRERTRHRKMDDPPSMRFSRARAF
jgi:hypothetical protein